MGCQGIAALNSTEPRACPPGAHDLWVMGLTSHAKGWGHRALLWCSAFPEPAWNRQFTSQTKRDLLLLLFYILEVARLGEFKGWRRSTCILWKHQSHTGEVIYPRMHNYFMLKSIYRCRERTCRHGWGGARDELRDWNWCMCATRCKTDS